MARSPCESPVADRTSEGFLSPVKTGSRDPSDLLTPGSKPGATVLTPATPTVRTRQMFSRLWFERTSENFLSPVKTGSRGPAGLLTPGSKPGATVLTPATPTVRTCQCFAFPTPATATVAAIFRASEY